MGSNVANVGLTLGAAALAAPHLVRWRALSPLLIVLVLGTIAVLALGADGTLSRVEGMVLLLAYAACFAFALARSAARVRGSARGRSPGIARTSSMLGQNLIRCVSVP